MLGAVGVVLPGLPTTPLLLAASWLFYRSSPKLQQRLLNSRLGIYIRGYNERGGMRPITKAWAVVLMATMTSLSVALWVNDLVGDIVVATAGFVGCLVVIFKVPNAKKQS